MKYFSLLDVDLFYIVGRCLFFFFFTCSLLHAAPLFVLSAWCLTTTHLLMLGASLWGNKEKCERQKKGEQL